MFAITPKGLKRLQNWLAQPHQPTIERNELLLKMFFGGFQNLEVSIAHLDRALAEGKRYLELLQNVQSAMSQMIPEPHRAHIESTIFMDDWLQRRIFVGPR